MLNATSEKLLSKILSVGAALVTILVISESVTDPVNAPKLTALGIVAFAALGVVVFSGVGNLAKSYKEILALCGFFVLSMFYALSASKSPWSQNIYGAYGRNNGLITYLFLVMILLSALTLRSSKSFESISKSLIFAGLVNISYSLWVIAFGDFIGWSNPYGNILGTFGNPNFIGSFLGIFFTAYIAFAMVKSTPKIMKYSTIVVLPITALAIYKSHAIQGRVVAMLGIGILAFLIIRSRFGALVSGTYLILGFATGLLALFGALQIGPLAKYIYKTSVSLRGQYWLAAWNTGENHPLSGVGMDSFGDWYRRSRDSKALELPGVNTVVNAAHNVPLDMFAFGGWPLFLSYIAIVGATAFSVIRTIRRSKDFDPVFAILLTSWVGYQIQSIISINQIGLAVWGWLLSGTLIAYDKVNLNKEDNLKSDKNQDKAHKARAGESSLLVLIGVVSGLVGLVLALPPMVSDTKWRRAQLTGSAIAIEETMNPSFYNLPNTTKYLQNIQALESSGLFEMSHKYTLQALQWNSESYDLWRILYLVKNSTPMEKIRAVENMKRLDPLNPDVTLNQ